MTDRALRRLVGVAVGDGTVADIDLVATDRPADPRQVGAAATVVQDDAGDFLVVHSTRRGTWDCPGGRREPDESVLDCARRELHEETGLDLPPERFLPCGYERITVDLPGHWAAGGSLVQVYRLRLPERRPAVRSGDDVDGARWVTPEQFRRRCATLFWWPLAEHVMGAR